MCDGFDVGRGVDDTSSSERPNVSSVDSMCGNPCDVANRSESAMSLIKDEVVEVSVENVGRVKVMFELLSHGSVCSDDDGRRE